MRIPLARFSSQLCCPRPPADLFLPTPKARPPPSHTPSFQGWSRPPFPPLSSLRLSTSSGGHHALLADSTLAHTARDPGSRCSGRDPVTPTVLTEDSRRTHHLKTTRRQQSVHWPVADLAHQLLRSSTLGEDGSVAQGHGPYADGRVRRRSCYVSANGLVSRLAQNSCRLRMPAHTVEPPLLSLGGVLSPCGASRDGCADVLPSSSATSSACVHLTFSPPNPRVGAANPGAGLRMLSAWMVLPCAGTSCVSIA